MEQLFYNIITYIIIAFAAYVALKKMYEKFMPQNKSKSHCDSGCGGCGTPCELKDMVNKTKTI